MENRRLGITLLILVLIAVIATGCGDQPGMAADQAGDTGMVDPDVANRLPEEIQRLQVTIDGGVFEHSVYEVQPGSILMTVKALGGPYTFEINNLVEPTGVSAGSVRQVGFTAPNPGEYTMRILRDGTSAGETGRTAILRVLSPDEG